jgi:hypothetical protein
MPSLHFISLKTGNSNLFLPNYKKLSIYFNFVGNNLKHFFIHPHPT